MPKVRIGVISERDILSRDASAPFYMFRALRHRTPDAVTVSTGDAPLLRRLNRIGARFVPGSARLSRQTAEALDARARTLAGRAAKAIDRLARAGRPIDCLVAPMSTHSIAMLDPPCPLVFYSDATVALMRSYYNTFADQPPEVLERLERYERAAMGKASFLVYSSKWAAASAIKDYGIDPDRIAIAPLGANVDRAPEPPERAGRGPSDPWRLLLIGLDWQRKGADDAVGALRVLRARGRDASLTVVGCAPPHALEREPGLTIVPYVAKDTPEGSATMDRLYREHDLFVLPSHAETFGHVVCEAASYALPTVARRTGGLTESVLDGRTGLLVDEHLGPEAYADAIEGVLGHPETHLAMCRAALDDFRDRVNYGAWAETMLSVIDRVRAGVDL